MCGRFVQTNERELLQRLFHLSQMQEGLASSYNVAPSQPVLAIAERNGHRKATTLKWGLVPSWATDSKIGNSLINARAETVSTLPSFKNAFKHRRCLIPVDGFYEWLKRDGEKLPFYFHMTNKDPFAFAGLYEVNDKTGDTLSTCTVITTEADAVMIPVHDRMPAILPPDDYDLWLDPEASVKSLLPLLRPYEGEDFTVYPVSKEVNSPRNNSPDLLQPVPFPEGFEIPDPAPNAPTPNSK